MRKPPMQPPRLNLVVLRVADIERSAAFYRLLGLECTKHAHGSGPRHYACESDGFVLELYPASPEQPVSSSTRIGFAVADVDRLTSELALALGAGVVAAPKDSEWGRRAVIADPDGHRVELLAPAPRVPAGHGTGPAPTPPAAAAGGRAAGRAADVPPTDSQPVPLFALWLPAVEAGVVPLEKLVAWADGQIGRLPQPPPWLIELSLARNVEGVRRAERAAGERTEASDAGQLYLGFLYLAHESGRLPMAKLLLEAGRFADGRGHESAIPECEAFYLLLNEIDGGGPTLPEEGPLDDRVSELFAPVAAKARRALADLPPEWRK